MMRPDDFEHQVSNPSLNLMFKESDLNTKIMDRLDALSKNQEFLMNNQMQLSEMISLLANKTDEMMLKMASVATGTNSRAFKRLVQKKNEPQSNRSVQDSGDSVEVGLNETSKLLSTSAGSEPSKPTAMPVREPLSNDLETAPNYSPLGKNKAKIEREEEESDSGISSPTNSAKQDKESDSSFGEGHSATEPNDSQLGKNETKTEREERKSDKDIASPTNSAKQDGDSDSPCGEGDWTTEPNDCQLGKNEPKTEREERKSDGDIVSPTNLAKENGEGDSKKESNGSQLVKNEAKTEREEQKSDGDIASPTTSAKKDGDSESLCRGGDSETVPTRENEAKTGNKEQKTNEGISSPTNSVEDNGDSASLFDRIAQPYCSSSTEFNMEEAQRCIDRAKKCIAEGSIEEAKLLLLKAVNLNHIDAQSMLKKLEKERGEARTKFSGKKEKIAKPSLMQLQEVQRILKCENHYEVLNISTKATESEIKTAYKKLAVLIHPDKNDNAPGAAASFIKLEKARCTLTDPEKRKQYDASCSKTKCSTSEQHQNQSTENTSGFKADRTAGDPFEKFSGTRSSPSEQHQNQFTGNTSAGRTARESFGNFFDARPPSPNDFFYTSSSNNFFDNVFSPGYSSPSANRQSSSFSYQRSNECGSSMNSYSYTIDDIFSRSTATPTQKHINFISSPLNGMSVDKVPGIGKKAADQFARCGITTARQLEELYEESPRDFENALRQRAPCLNSRYLKSCAQGFASHPSTGRGRNRR